MNTFPHTITHFASALRQGQHSCVGIVQHFLQGICVLNPTLRAIITVTSAQALQQAEILDAEAHEEKFRGPLHGVPIVHKDLFAVAGERCTVGSGLFYDRITEHDSNVAARLRAAGCIVLGQANMSEFAGTPLGRNASYGDVRNPWNIKLSPGTSSSGSAVAVAANLCLAATGSDTGGSIRAPASFCGLVGIRPTPGLVGLSGVFPRSPSLDVAGTLAHSVEDTALLLDCLASDDPRDPASLHHELNTSHANDLILGVAGLRVGIIPELTFQDIHPDTKVAIEHAICTLKDSGAKIISLEFPDVLNSFSGESMYEIICKEFETVLAPAVKLAAARKYTFDPAIYGDLERAKSCTEAHFEELLQLRATCRQASGELFAEADVILMPTQTWCAPPYDNAPPPFWRAQRRLLAPATFLGLPSISVPCGFSEGLPLGAQLVGPTLSESHLLRIAACIESGVEKRVPAVWWGK